MGPRTINYSVSKILWSVLRAITRLFGDFNHFNSVLITRAKYKLIYRSERKFGKFSKISIKYNSSKMAF